MPSEMYNRTEPRPATVVGSGLWTKNTAFWARNRGTKKGAVWLRP